MPETIVTETTTGRERLLTPATLWFMLFCFTGNCSLSILFSALPLFAERTTGYALTAGLTTGAIMATVLDIPFHQRQRRPGAIDARLHQELRATSGTTPPKPSGRVGNRRQADPVEANCL